MFCRKYLNLRRSISTSCIDLIYIKKEICPFFIYQLKDLVERPIVIDKCDLTKSHNDLIGMKINPKLNSTLIIKNEDKRLINHFINERLIKEYPNIDYKSFILLLLNPINFKKRNKRAYDDFKEYLDYLFENLKFLLKFINEDKLNSYLSIIFNFNLKFYINFLNSFRFKINNTNLLSQHSTLKVLNHDELRKVYYLKGDLIELNDNQIYGNKLNINELNTNINELNTNEYKSNNQLINQNNLETDLIERRLTLINYLTEEEKTKLFREDKDELYKLNLENLDQILNIRLVEYFFEIDKPRVIDKLINFNNLNSILNIYSKFTRKDIHFLNYKSLIYLDFNFFNFIISNLSDDYFKNYINLEKLKRFFMHTNIDNDFNLIKNYLPNLKINQIIDLLSSDYKSKNLNLIIPLFFKIFDITNLNENQIFELLFNFIEYLPKDEKTINNFIRSSMFLTEKQNELEFIKLFLIQQSNSSNQQIYKRQITSNANLVESYLKLDKKIILKQLKEHPNSNKIKIGNLPLIIDYLFEQQITIDQIKNNLKILLYSIDSIRDKFDLIKKDDEFYNRIKNKDNFLEYLIYFLEKENSFSGTAVFVNK